MKRLIDNYFPLFLEKPAFISLLDVLVHFPLSLDIRNMQLAMYCLLIKLILFSSISSRKKKLDRYSNGIDNYNKGIDYFATLEKDNRFKSKI